MNLSLCFSLRFILRLPVSVLRSLGVPCVTYVFPIALWFVLHCSVSWILLGFPPFLVASQGGLALSFFLHLPVVCLHLGPHLFTKLYNTLVLCCLKSSSSFGFSPQTQSRNILRMDTSSSSSTSFFLSFLLWTYFTLIKHAHVEVQLTCPLSLASYQCAIRLTGLDSSAVAKKERRSDCYTHCLWPLRATSRRWSTCPVLNAKAATRTRPLLLRGR